MADEKLLPGINLMLPPVCIVCQSPNVAITPSMGSVMVCGVVVVVDVVSGRLAAFLNVPQALIIAASIKHKTIFVFFIINNNVLYDKKFINL
jgi:hypothetical protein